MYQAPAPPEFLSKPGQRPGNWQAWFEDFIMYGEASGWSDWSDLRRTAFLLTSVGAEARRLYRAAVSVDDADLKSEGSVSDDHSGTHLRFDKAVSVLKKLFASDADVRSARLQFRQIKQRHGESNVIFLANLREAVAKCNFGELTDEMLRDAFIEGCMSDPLRDKLIMTDRLTLSQLEELAAAHDRGLQRKALLQGTVSFQSPAPVEVAFAGRRTSAPARRTPQKQLAVEHVKGQLNPSDGLSRLPGPEQEVEDDESELVACLADETSAVSREELAVAGREDAEVRALMDQIPREWPRRFSDVDDVLRPYFRCKQELAIDGELVLRGERIVVPTVLRPRLLTLAHESHQGIVRTKQRLRALFWWPGMDAAVETTIKECPACIVADKTAKTRFAPLSPVPLPAAAWDKMADQQSVDRRQYLQSYLRTYRATPHGTTGRSPSELLHGRQMRTDLDSAVAPEGGSTGDAALRQRVSRKQRQMKRHFDNRKRVCTVS
ncbi:uncharacterized protein LOC122371763 isoform X3 [Amphibalanus amphitrite]|uniref:uncharacterized protein LOC122371763 isoform X3 n=1 Tax=Amphibalanus amphitrite TaxID=1232801 RepID=UPI001C91F52B|nr:uncharacterized protein LOC122371763 isoform X3 [Amphibalanus amphitrite]